jgi:hypothetical protein
MPYLTYLIDNYENLPSTIAFIHSHKEGYPQAWHTDAEQYSNVLSLNTLKLDFVQSNGYANLRCIHIPGCPDEMRPFRNPPEGHRSTEHALPAAWTSLFPGVEIPQVIGVPCCAQFAVSRERVRERPVEDYIRYRNWLISTDLADAESGRMLEYLWHIIFGMSSVYCPTYEQCKCDVYGQLCP